MPELPEVETTKKSLEPLLQQKVMSVEVREPRLRWAIPQDIQKLQGQKLIRLNRRSKYILAQFEHDNMLWHLGMSGSFRLCEPATELRKHDHLIISFENIQLRYHDPRRFGCILWLNHETQHKLIDPLGQTNYFIFLGVTTAIITFVILAFSPKIIKAMKGIR